MTAGKGRARRQMSAWVTAASLVLVSSAHAQIQITGVSPQGQTLNLEWTAAAPRYVVQRTPALSQPFSHIGPVLATNRSAVDASGPAGFYRIRKVAVVAFGDTNIDAAVSASIPIKHEPAGEYYDIDMEGIGTLDVPVDAGVSNLAGLEALMDLEELTVAVNTVRDISALGGLVALRSLDLGYNQIADIAALAGLTNLAELNVEYNNIGDIGVLSNLVVLTHLNLRRNQISDLAPLRNLLNLRQLNLADNLVEDLGPLVENARAGGLGAGSTVYLGVNPLSDYAQTNQIPELESHGVTVVGGP